VRRTAQRPWEGHSSSTPVMTSFGTNVSSWSSQLHLHALVEENSQSRNNQTHWHLSTAPNYQKQSRDPDQMMAGHPILLPCTWGSSWLPSWLSEHRLHSLRACCLEGCRWRRVRPLWRMKWLIASFPSLPFPSSRLVFFFGGRAARYRGIRHLGQQQSRDRPLVQQCYTPLVQQR